MACEKETNGKDTFEPIAIEGKLDVDEGSDDNYSSRDEMESDFDKDDE